MIENPFDKIPDVPTLEKRFKFIDNDIVRQNTTICFQYIIFLGVVNETYGRDGPVRLSLYRDMMVHAGSVIEACLYYGVMKLVEKGNVSTGLIKYWEVKATKEIHTFSKDEDIVAQHRLRKFKILKSNAPSQDINEAAKSAGILDDDLYEKAEAIRTARNNIHFAGKTVHIPYPSRESLDEMFANARLIIDRVEEKLTNL